MLRIAWFLCNRNVSAAPTGAPPTGAAATLVAGRLRVSHRTLSGRGGVVARDGGVSRWHAEDQGNLIPAVAGPLNAAPGRMP